MIQEDFNWLVWGVGIWYWTSMKKIDTNLEDIKKLNCPSVGSTATIVFIEKKENKRFLYCANIGDSRCVLVNKNAIYRLSYDHRVADLKENNRILSGGGIIVNGRVYGILMLSRSFGDFQTKGYGVIVTPHVIKYELKEDDLYCVIASDGVWDVVKDSDCAVLEQMGKMGMNTGELSRRMINEALKRKSKDIGNTRIKLIKGRVVIWSYTLIQIGHSKKYL